MPCSTSNDEILWLIAYRRNDFERSVLPLSYKGNWITFTRIVGVSHGPDLSGSGYLDVLPVEILNAILEFSDLLTLSILRQVNRRARIIVEAFRPYKLIVTHAPHVIDVLIRTGAASHFTAVQVFSVMCSSSCAICDGFGTFLWIPDCIRCCMLCLREAPELLPMTMRDAKAAFGLSSQTFAQIPIVDTLPGIYGLDNHLYVKKRRLLSEGRAREAAVMLHGGEEGLAAYINSDTSQAKTAYDKRVARLNATRSEFDSKGRLNNFVDDIRRFQVSTCFPYFDPLSNSTHYGVACRGCEAAMEKVLDEGIGGDTLHVALDRRERTYLEGMLLEHFNSCADAQRILAEHQGSNIGPI